MHSRSKIYRIGLVVLVLGVVLVVGMVVGDYLNIDEHLGAKPSPTDVNEQGTHYQFINPLLFCQDENVDNGFTDAVSQQITDQVKQYIDDETQKGDISAASMYYKDLNEGPSTGVYTSLPSIPASLLKVPLAISVYVHAQNDPGFLDSKLTFAGGANTNAPEHFQPAQSIQPGQTYTVRDLVRYMLADSDNNAVYLLSNELSQSDLQNTYSDLGIEPPTNLTPNYTVDVKTYASFFRVLYNASYIDRGPSEEILSMLAQTNFTQGLVAGLPAGIVVAHKFGESTADDGTEQLQDCGIIYVPNSPYLLCVMTHGSNFDTLAKVLAHISQTVYTIIEKENQS